MFGLFSCDIGVDLGTANTLVHVAGQGIVINEPTVVAMDRKNDRVTVIGGEAKKMLGRTPGNLAAIRPMKDGVIADFQLVEILLSTFIKRVQKYPLFLVKPRVVIGVPSGITEVEKRAVIDAARMAGAKEVHLVHEPMAAAIGMGIPVDGPVGNMIVDIGGGTSDIAVIALNGIACNASVRVGGDEMDEAVVNYLRKTYNLAVDENTAEQIKWQIGSASPLEEELTMDVKGRDVMADLPRTMTITSQEIREALNEPVTAIVDAVKQALASTPPALSADILDCGIIMSGGGSKLRGLDARISKETGLSVNVIDDPLLCVCKGAARILEDLDKYRPVLIASTV
ncbi:MULTISPECIES: rod shape-determining protein [Fibrobacter]|uniref:Cell shape-determining protein MreB n=1 Tax=Fibrobacter intestinalis TaxID=28122 RepID=A0A1M6VY17_9BACT|nr:MULTISPECIES: rod shape-determining protein [Fibrobacter]MDD7299371.1 rod shape-determining protein [Fibrobacter intestinalis]PBC68662.1 rod shape-determining protein MreB [Fibrobacter sp. UWS1]PBC73907.1 rod shape-determining protein MreB [Fibrobacter sp. NR9]SHK86371.1 rod shape-determining protein MreB [Fibrobacter intestinalis]SJZ55932.1 rod shape-determining protein MreB [Fibrobacter intestinalis]